VRQAWNGTANKVRKGLCRGSEDQFLWIQLKMGLEDCRRECVADVWGWAMLTKKYEKPTILAREDADQADS